MSDGDIANGDDRVEADSRDSSHDGTAAGSPSSSKRTPAPARPFPRRTLEQALRVPRALRDHNGGNPWDSQEVAAALGVGAKTGATFYLTSAAKHYGLTEGTNQTSEISLTDLGREAVYPPSPEAEQAASRDGRNAPGIWRRARVLCDHAVR